MRLVISLLLFILARYKWIDIDTSHVRFVSVRRHACLCDNDVTLSTRRYSISRNLSIYTHPSLNYIITLINLLFKYPTTPKTHILTTRPNYHTTTNLISVNYTARPLVNENLESTTVGSTICEDEDLGGPNCPLYTGPIAVYRFSLAMVLFYFFLMIFTFGVSTSRSSRGLVHNG